MASFLLDEQDMTKQEILNVCINGINHFERIIEQSEYHNNYEKIIAGKRRSKTTANQIKRFRKYLDQYYDKYFSTLYK